MSEVLDQLFNDAITVYLSNYFSERIFEPNVTYHCNKNSHIGHRGNLTIDYVGASSGQAFYLYSFLLVLVEKITCSLGLSIKFVSYLEGYYTYKTFLLDPIYIDYNATAFGEIVAMEQVFMIEIMTCAKKTDESRYFSFFYLFTSMVWLCMGLSILINALLWSHTYGPQMSANRALRLIIRSITGQAINGFRKLIRNKSRNQQKRNKKIIFLSLFAIWLMFSNIAMKCMSSVLLNSYIKLSPKPLFTSLTGIYNNKQVMIAGSDSIRYLKEIKSPLVKEQDKKFLDDDEYPIAADQLDFLKTLTKVFKGEAVILDNSHGIRHKQILLQGVDGLAVADKKYAPTYNTFYINKEVEFKNEILKLIRNGREAGLYWHYRQIEDMKVNLRKMILSELSPRYNKLRETSLPKIALTLTDMWRGAFSILIIGYLVTIVIVFLEKVGHRFIEKHLYSDSLLLSKYSPSSIVYKYFYGQKKFVKRAKRLKSLTYEPMQVHRVLRSNYRLYFKKN